jgi:Rad3-related DNA helicase
VSDPITTEDWIDFFPPTDEGVRPDQEKAINFILNRLAEATRNVFLQGPTGTGKTFIAWTVANYHAVQSHWRTRILVPDRFLAEQYVKDFAPLGLVQLHSSEHYDCPSYVSCDIGRGSELVRVEVPNGTLTETDPAAETVTETLVKTVSKPLCQYYEECSYITARTAFTGAAIAVTNASYAFTCARYRHEFVCGDLAVLDEAHSVGDRICRMYEISVPLSRGTKEPPEGGELDWVRTDYLPGIRHQILLIESETIRRTRIWADDPELLKLQRKYTSLQATLNNLVYLAGSNEDEWVVDRQKYNHQLLFQPLWATRLAPPLLDFLAPRRLLMSATILDFPKQAAWLGLDSH